MTLPAGTRIGPYEVVGPLGAGGMGEVYRARDGRLKRDVALKILPGDLSHDAERLARFEREAQVLASLNHTNIAQVYGVESANGSLVIVMEVVEGATLAGRLKAGAVSPTETLTIAKQICDGLEAAHERQIIHRDLKPANLKVRDDGVVKILDFGLAKAMDPVSGPLDARPHDLQNSPTMTGRMTEHGLILGTVAYMSPEQARGKVVDKRADIWAFGCVLFEMLTGAPPFTGETTTDILAAVVERQPDWSRLPKDLSPRVSELLRRCLQKDPRQRLRDIADARFEIEAASHPDAERVHATGIGAVRARSSMLPWLAVAALVVVVALLGVREWASRNEDLPAAPVIRAVLPMPAKTTLTFSRGSSLALSPDGRRLVFSAAAEGRVQLFVRALDSLAATAIPGTEGAANPFFSPDGGWVGFFADEKMKKVALAGGAPVTITDARAPRGEAWGPGDLMLITPTSASEIVRVSPQDGTATPLTKLETGELSHRWPQILPGGKAVLFTIWNDVGWEPARVAVQAIDSPTHKVIVQGGGFARYIRDGTSQRGYVVYAKADGLMAAPFDESTLEVIGPAVSVLDDLITNLSGGAQFSISDNGTLAYLPGGLGEGHRDLVWVTRDGKSTPATSLHQLSIFFSLSPDGTRILRGNPAGPHRDVWLDDLARATSTRVTSKGDNYSPVWSADGKWILYTEGLPTGNIYRTAEGSGAVERLTTSPNTQRPNSVSPDGAVLAFAEDDPVTASDIWVLPLGGSGTPRAFLKTKANESFAAFSPDGKWLAYQTNESGRFEICVQPFPGGGRAIAISTRGGIWPIWSPDGREILYRGRGEILMSAGVSTSPVFTADPPRELFDARRYENVFRLSPDGRRFLMMPLFAQGAAPTAVHVVVNWIEQLRQRVR